MDRVADYSSHAIAVIGMAVWYPGAHNLRHFWENILCKRQQFREMLDCRLPISEYWDKDKAAPDKTYGRWAAYIEDLDFDWRSKRIPKSAVDSTDIVHWLALEVALKALKDAGYSREDIKGSHTSVILGNTLTGEWTRSNSMRTRWPFVEKVMKRTAEARGLNGEAFAAYLADVEAAFKSVFPPVDEDTLAGGLSNTVAGRVCNYLDLHGGGYTVDGACSSSLLAVATAANSLVAREVDMAFAGGVDISLDNFELIGFAKTGALTGDEMRVYDQRASGFIPGEGCGFVVLKRLDDAIAAGDRIYAKVLGWGISSDGKGGLTAPSVKGQSMALRAAYAKAGYDASEVDFIEGHGTGTPLGDRTELKAICDAMQIEPGDRCVGVTSLKSVLGHTKAAAGIGAFIKAVIGVNRRVLPPISGTAIAHDVFQAEAKPLYPLIDGAVRPSSDILRAGVSAMGFGGINSHITLQSYGPPARHLRPFVDEAVLMAHPEDAELFVFAGTSLDRLRHAVQEALEDCQHIALAEMADFAAGLALRCPADAAARAGFCADTPAVLRQRLEALLALIGKGVREGAYVRDEPKTIWLGNGVGRTRLAFLFPGQGSQRINMTRSLIRRFPWAAELLAQCEAVVEEQGTAGFRSKILVDNPQVLSDDQTAQRQRALAQTEVAQPAIILGSIAWYHRLADLGLTADAVGGHSLGELMALYAGGVVDAPTLFRLAARRGHEMSPARGDRGGRMAALKTDLATVRGILALSDAYATVANINGPEQIVISGDDGGVDAAVREAASQGIDARLLPVSNAFHSKLMDGASARFDQAFADLSGRVSGRQVYSCVDGHAMHGEIDVGAHLAQQMLAQVDFVSLAKAIAADADLVLEVGPGRILSDLFGYIVGKDKVPALPVEPQAGSAIGFKQALAAAHVFGHDLNWQALYTNRLIRPFVPVRLRKFVENPCEREITVPVGAPALHIGVAAAAVSPTAVTAGVAPTPRPVLDVTFAEAPQAAAVAVPVATPTTAPAVVSALARVTELASELTGYEVATLAPDMRLLDDLNMDSIKSAELLAILVREFGVETQGAAAQYANASLQVIAEWIEQSRSLGGATSPVTPAATETAAASPATAAVKKADALQLRLLTIVAELTQFEIDTLDVEMRLLDDLNMDSIKSAELLTLLTREFNLGERLPLSQYANARISDLARVIAGPDAPGSVRAELAAATQPAPLTFPRRPSWVRNFRETAERRDLADPVELAEWRNRPLWLIRAEDDPLADACAQVLAEFGARIDTSPITDTRSGAPASAENVLIVLPDAGKTLDRATLTSFIGLLQGATVAAFEVNGRSAKPRITLVQRHARHPERHPGNPVFGIVAYVLSIAQERPDVAIQAISVGPDTGADLAAIAGAIGREMLAPRTLPSIALDADAGRWAQTCVVDDPCDYTQTPVAWTGDDVVLVTGGARGITAECALAFAKTTGVGMALVGSSPEPQTTSDDAASKEILATLDRYAAAGLRCRYFSVDVTDEAAVRDLVGRIQTELGPVTGLIHGAGLNKPRPITTVSAEDAVKECAPKVLGFAHLMAALDVSRLKAVIGFTSIIGVTGMPGNAIYAFANAALANALADLRRTHPDTHVIGIAYSVWDEVGMGARLGSIEKLGSAGIGAIPVAEGVDRFLCLALADAGTSEVIVAGRMGGNPTWNRAASTAVVGGEGALIYHCPQVETVIRRRLSLKTDPYLLDHNFKGSYLFPTVFGLEAMWRAVMQATGHQQSPESLSIIDISLIRPMTAGHNYDSELEVYAEVLERESSVAPLQVRAGIRCDLSGFEADHFAATFVLQPLGEGPLHDVAYDDPLPIAKLGPLYGDILFQGPLFQRINSIHRLENPEPGKGICVFRSAHTRDGFHLGDPYFRDSLLQSVQIIIPRDLSLPIGIDRIDLFPGWNEDRPERTCVAYLHRRDGDCYESSVLALGDDGRIIQRLDGYRLKILETRASAKDARDLVPA